MHSAPLAFYNHNPLFRSRYLNSRYRDAWRLHCSAPARVVGGLLNPVVDAGGCRARYNGASVKQNPSSV